MSNYEFQFSGSLADYVTAIAWSPDGNTLAASSAAGEVILWENGESTLQAATGQSANGVAFSASGLLAIGGQDGRVKIWRLSTRELIATLDATAWVDKLAWSPTSNQLAFSVGREVQVWNADTQEVVTLNFESSSVLGIDWRGDGKYLALAGYQGVKIWDAENWQEDPVILSVATASVAIAWSADGKYLASGNMDRTISVLEWNNSDPWLMSGFPGKVRQIAWSTAKTPQGTPILAASSIEGIVVWELIDEATLWDGRVLVNHSDTIQALAFAPNSFLLASGADDGYICLWDEAQEVSQILEGVRTGFSCLAWHPQGNQLAAGGKNGEVLIWSITSVEDIP